MVLEAVKYILIKEFKNNKILMQKRNKNFFFYDYFLSLSVLLLLLFKALKRRAGVHCTR